MTDLSTPTNVGQLEQAAESLITQHIDIWTTAIERKSSAGRGTSNKFSLYGIKKLRELILELAVRGKLVPQASFDERNSPDYEPASVLLERIAAEKAQLVKEGKLKKQKPLPEISDDEKPFELPQGWAWIRLGDYAQIFSGNAFKSGDFSSELGVKSIKITNAGVGHLIETDEFLPKEFLDIYHAFLVKKDDLILALTRPYISDGLKVSMCPESYHNSLLNQRVAAIRAYLNPEFAFFILRSPYVLNTYKNRFGGSGLQPNLKMSDVTDLLIPICSEQEQHRIVAKVDELMSLCDALEAQKEASIAAHQTLVETLLNALLLPNIIQQKDSQLASPESSFSHSLEPALNDSFLGRWNSVAEHFHTLFTTEASIDTLKQTILQLAVMGKLVEQDENDEPAVKLLERIKAEKSQLIKDGKIKKQKPLPEICEHEKPFELPKSWAWARLGEYAEVKGGKRLPKGHTLISDKTAYAYIRVTDMKDGSVNLHGLQYLTADTQKLIQQYTISKNDLYITIAGTIGEVGSIPEELDGMNLTENAAKIIFNQIDRLWLKRSLSANFSMSQFIEKVNQLAQPKLALHRILSSILPIPPIEEQYRIVTKVDELMTLCDQLKARLSDAQTTQLHLTDAIVEQAI